MKKVWIGVIILLVFFACAWTTWYWHVNTNPYDTQAQVHVPEFTEIKTGLVNKFDSEKSLPFVGAAIIDIDGDGIPEIFVGGGYDQNDRILKFKHDRFIDVSQELGLQKSSQDSTFGVSVIDANQDGRSDVFVARESGVYVYWNWAAGFKEQKLNIELDASSTPLSLALADLNHDGYVDIFVCGYIKIEQVQGQTIFNDQQYGGSSRLFLNNGDNSFRDITQAAGLEYVHNTFQAVFADLDDDQDLDLTVAYDTGTVRTWRNDGNLKFTNMKNPTSAYFSYPMGIAVGDYDNDGKLDLFYSNVGTTLPSAMLRGDLKEDQVLNKDWILLKNNGDFSFTDMAKAASIAAYEFSWGAVFSDLNLDGREDLLVAESYIGMPLFALGQLPGRVLLQNPGHQFAAVESPSGLVNKHYGITPLIADFNKDRLPDVVHVNIDGPLRVFLQEKGSVAKTSVEVKLKDIPQNIGSFVLLKDQAGHLLQRQDFIQGEGLCSDQEHVLRFGTTDLKGPFQLEIFYPDGRKSQKTKIQPGDTIIL